MFPTTHVIGLFVAGLALAALGQEASTTVTNAAPAKPLWDTSAHVGLTLTRGNSRNLLLSGDVASTRKWDKNEILLGADGVYGEAAQSNGETVKNAEKIHGLGQYNRLFTERFFGYVRLEGLHDGIAGVDYRLSVSPGVGYYFVKKPNTTLSGEVGPGYVYERLFGEDPNNYATLRLAERLEHKLNDRVKLWESVEFLPQVDKFDNYVVNAEVGIETAITKKFTQRVSILDTYRNQPPNNRLHNDLMLIAAIGYKF